MQIGPSFAASEVAAEGEPAARARRVGSHVLVETERRFVPPASLMSMGAMAPRKSEARKDDTSETREVAAQSAGWRVRKRRICGPLKRCGGRAHQSSGRARWAPGHAAGSVRAGDRKGEGTEGGKKETYMMRPTARHTRQLLRSPDLRLKRLTLSLCASILPIRAIRVRERGAELLGKRTARVKVCKQRLGLAAPEDGSMLHPRPA